MSGQRLTLSVGELNEYVRRSLAGDPMLRGVRLRGEISNFKRHVSGHWYFSLKDEQSTINCAMFRSAADGVGFAPKDGQQVILTGSAGLYVKTGSYQFYADAMELDGIGELYRQMEELKSRLAREGLFDASLKKPLPLLPVGVGIVTSGTGAVIHDIARVSWRRDPGMPLYLFAVAVQGAGAAEQIARGLQALDAFPAVDVIIVGRGGGSMEDLWAFNEETVARAIASCHKPVVSAVGHETDFTIADFVADLRAPTPSAAAELAVPIRDALLAEVEKRSQRMRRAAETAIVNRAEQLSQLRRRLAEQTPENQLRAMGDRLTALEKRMRYGMETVLLQNAHRLEASTLRLRAASPQATLGRGYALVRQQGQTVQKVEDLRLGEPLTITFQDGLAEATASRKQKENTI